MLTSEAAWEKDKKRIMRHLGVTTLSDETERTLSYIYATGFNTGWAEGEHEAGRDGYEQGFERGVEHVRGDVYGR